MPEEAFYSEEVHPTVAEFITEHGGRVQTERVPPAWVFHKVTLPVKTSRRYGGGDFSPIYLYTLEDGGQLLIQYIRSKGAVPDHYDAYWVAIYIFRKEEHGNGTRRKETS